MARRDLVAPGDNQAEQHTHIIPHLSASTQVSTLGPTGTEGLFSNDVSPAMLAWMFRGPRFWMGGAITTKSLLFVSARSRLPAASRSCWLRKKRMYVDIFLQTPSPGETGGSTLTHSPPIILYKFRGRKVTRRLYSRGLVLVVCIPFVHPFCSAHEVICTVFEPTGSLSCVYSRRRLFSSP